MVGPVALAYLTVEGASPIEQIEAAAAAGFGGVGLRFSGPSDRPLAHPVIGHRPLIREIRASCAQTGVPVFDIEMVVVKEGFNPIDALPVIEAASEVDAQFLQVVSEDTDQDRAAHHLRALDALAAAHGVGLALEFMPFRAIRTLGQAVEAIERGELPNTRVVIDALHFQRSGGSPADLVDLDVNSIAYVQLCDAPAASPPADRLLDEARGDRLNPGEGELPLAQLFASLPGSIPVSVEVPGSSTGGETARIRARRCAEVTRRFFLENRIDAASFVNSSPVHAERGPA